jgi:hypothetical protein
MNCRSRGVRSESTIVSIRLRAITPSAASSDFLRQVTTWML